MNKPGWKTTEFWITGGANIIGLLALGGIFSPENTPAVTENFTQAVGSVFAIIANVSYIWSRTKVKQSN